MTRACPGIALPVPIVQLAPRAALVISKRGSWPAGSGQGRPETPGRGRRLMTWEEALVVALRMAPCFRALHSHAWSGASRRHGDAQTDRRRAPARPPALADPLRYASTGIANRMSFSAIASNLHAKLNASVRTFPTAMLAVPCCSLPRRRASTRIRTAPQRAARSRRRHGAVRRCAAPGRVGGRVRAKSGREARRGPGVSPAPSASPPRSSPHSAVHET